MYEKDGRSRQHCRGIFEQGLCLSEIMSENDTWALSMHDNVLGKTKKGVQ
jgi:hypothetical protein